MANKGGRPRKPAALHRLTGTFERHAHAKQEKNEARFGNAGLLTEMEPPALLNDRQRDMWRRLLAVAPVGVVTVTDAPIFQAMVVALVDYEEAVESQNALRRQGQNALIMRGADGPKLSIFLRAQRYAMDTVLKCASELAFTPTARARLAAGLPPPPAEPAPAQGDPWNAFTVIPGGKTRTPRQAG